MTEETPRRLSPKEIDQIAHDEAVGRRVPRSTSDAEAYDREQFQAAMRENGPYLTLGMQMAMTIALGAAIGWWIDTKTGGSLWLGLGAGIGAVLGMTYFILVVMRMERSTTKKQKRNP